MWIFYVVAAVLGVAFVVTLARERRRFRNAVLLGLTLLSLGLGLLGEATRLDPEPLDILISVLFAGPAVAVFVLAIFLVLNGLTMLRREGHRLGNLLSLLAGLACLPVPALPLVTQYADNTAVSVVALIALIAVTYVGFVFCCYLLYSVVYGRLGARSGFDFVVVLGSRLIDGRVPPLLAARLDKAAAVWRAETRSGGAPLLIASGGQGPDEAVPEAHGMAEYLVTQGVPRESILCEDRSTTTRENLGLSAAIMAEHRPAPRCVVVTNDFHAFRAALLTRRAGLDGQVLGARTARYYWPSATIREFVAVLVEHRVANLVTVLVLVVLGVLLAVT